MVWSRAQLRALGTLDAVIFAAGQLPDQAQVNADFDLSATHPGSQHHQCHGGAQQGRHPSSSTRATARLVAISSVAGDRGRATNYAYGAAKGALEIFMSGLRQRLHKSGVQVLLVKPGFVDTPMTADFPKGPLWASPERVAKDIVQAMAEGPLGDLHALVLALDYAGIIRHIPERLFVRLRF
jgi:decaprenylphospho-beta-D-erythro-pentofuranosid-2-ulose 2-reductase